MIPGSNLLNRASRLIRFQQIQYFPYASRILNPVGQWETTYGDSQLLMASVQAVPRDTYVQLGLDLQRNYWNIFVSKDVVDLARDISGDQVVFNGKVCQIESQNSWFVSDGWAEALAVEVRKTP